MSHQAYRQAQRITEDPRQAEYRLFGQVTGALIEAKNKNAKGGLLVDAINWNQRLWSTLAADCLDDRNQLPREVRAQIVSLSIWVNRYSKDVVRRGAAMDPLIDVNRSIMQGLQGQS